MAAQAKDTIVLTPGSLPHVFLCDIDDNGLQKEIVVVKKFKDGSIYYIDVDTLHQIDKARLKKILMSPTAKMQECWEVMSQATLTNGLNALDFFHYNNVRVKRPKGARASVGGLESVQAYSADKMVGTEFGTNPAEAQLDPATRNFTV